MSTEIVKRLDWTDRRNTFSLVRYKEGWLELETGHNWHVESSVRFDCLLDALNFCDNLKEQIFGLVVNDHR